MEVEYFIGVEFVDGLFFVGVVEGVCGIEYEF